MVDEGGGPHVAVRTAPVRRSTWWLAAATLFFVSTALAAYRTVPGSLDAATLFFVDILTGLCFAAALVVSAVAATRAGTPLRLARGAVSALVLMAVWMPVWMLVRRIVPEGWAQAAIFADKIVLLALAGAVVAGVLRSALATPWRYLPAISLAVVVTAELLAYFLLSGVIRDTNVIVNLLNALLLLNLAAGATLGVVAVRASRAPRAAVPVLG